MLFMCGTCFHKQTQTVFNQAKIWRKLLIEVPAVMKPFIGSEEDVKQQRQKFSFKATADKGIHDEHKPNHYMLRLLVVPLA